MLRRGYLIYWLLIAPLLAAACARFVARVAPLETGLELLHLQCRDATVGWFVGRYEPVLNREPAQQAKLWLREANRILRQRPNDAELAIGAAWMLDTPGSSYSGRFSMLRFLD